MQFRRLNADEIEVRVAMIKPDKLSVLLYKDARVDQRLLDETVGAEYWQRSHEIVGGNLYCTVSIYNKDLGAWVSKQDVGTESNTEKEKGQASDSFKRACFNWGIGRELYTAPSIWINNPDAGIAKSESGKYMTNKRFKVGKIGYDEGGNINDLVITDSWGNPVWEMKSPAKKAAKPKGKSKDAEALNRINDADIQRIVDLCNEAGVVMSEAFNKPVKDFTPAEFARACEALQKIIDKKKVQA